MMLGDMDTGKILIKALFRLFQALFRLYAGSIQALSRALHASMMLGDMDTGKILLVRYY